jgi:hypothetical protein
VSPDPTRTRKLLAAPDFKALFIDELGWNHHNFGLEILVDGLTFTLSAVAEKCGMAAFVCTPGSDGRMPDYAMRRKIDRQVTKSTHEHLIIFIDDKQTIQVWQWVRRERGKPSACREHTYHSGQPGDSLIQKLQALAVSLEEEECLTLTDVTGRARKAFDVERVTKRFYDRFKAEHAAFLKFLEGIPDEEMERWYVSVMLDRLMFIYFIQKKGFLNNDTDYLKNKLAQCRRELGKDLYYRDFLCPLFFEGFAKRKDERSGKANKLLGEVPYLNGGIFMPHQVEQLFGKTISIPDKAFENLFGFFDAYHWHLDERPLKADNEINPDVLGYIFEKYINQKQMGAYYTKEDITEYISKNTVIPFLFDRTREKCKVAFEEERPVWGLLREDPDRYIYEAVQRGVVTQEGNILPESILPEFVQKGMHDPKVRMFNKDYNLGQAKILAPDGVNLAFPTETWREYAQRRERCLDLRRKLAAGEVRDINDLITSNLDIRQFAQDVIENCEGPEFLKAFWKAIETVTVLDPTCGSGAFLFAALNILEPLYEACLERMRFFLVEWGEAGKKNHPNYYKLFKETLKRVEDHPNPRYFILKSIIVNNLYGVDIMEEAVEICKLRLFLKLVAQIERAEDIEPLPDIDFNIRAGNTLVGFVSLDEIWKASELDVSGQHRIVFGETASAIDRIEEDAKVADRAFHLFQDMQTSQRMSPSEFSEAKENLRTRLRKLTDELDRFLASEYGISEKKMPNGKKFREAFANWRKTHQPFHWFAEFYGILKTGGFDVIIGNPPYVELKEVRDYRLVGYRCQSAGNLYAVMLERAFLIEKTLGRMGFIVPVSSVSTDRYEPLQGFLTTRNLHYSSFDDRPSRLFDGLEHCRLTVHLIGHVNEEGELHSTCYYKWNAEERQYLFPSLDYVLARRALVTGSLPKLSSLLEANIMTKLQVQKPRLSDFYSKAGKSTIFYSRKVGYFLQVLDFIPEVRDGKGRLRSPSEFKELVFVDAQQAKCALCCLNSDLFYWFVTAFSDCRHINKREIDAFPIDLQVLAKGPCGSKLTEFSSKLMKDLNARSGHRKMDFQHDSLTVQCIFPKLSKPIIDEIDRTLAKHYGFTDEELDFIVNYDIKYRMGQGTGEDEAE